MLSSGDSPPSSIEPNLASPSAGSTEPVGIEEAGSSTNHNRRRLDYGINNNNKSNNDVEKGYSGQNMVAQHSHSYFSTEEGGVSLEEGRGNGARGAGARTAAAEAEEAKELPEDLLSDNGVFGLEGREERAHGAGGVDAGRIRKLWGFERRRREDYDQVQLYVGVALEVGVPFSVSYVV